MTPEQKYFLDNLPVIIVIGVFIAFLVWATRPGKKEKTVQHKHQKYGTIDKTGIIHVGNKTLTPAEAERQGIHITDWHKEAKPKKKSFLRVKDWL